MKLAYQLEPADFVATARLQTNFVALAIVSAAVVFAAALAAGIDDGASLLSPWWRLPLIAGFAALAGAVLTLLFWALLIPIRARHFHRQNAKLYPTSEATVSAEGILFVNAMGSAQIVWSDMRGFRENRTLLLLEISRSMGFPIPKAGLSHEQLAQLQTAVRANLRRF